MSPTEACTTITSTFGAASRNNVAATGASSSRRVRGSNCTATAGAAGRSFENPVSAPIAFGDMTNSRLASG